MIEIKPIVPVFPVTKPAKILNDEERPEKNNHRERQEKNSDSDRHDTSGPAQHIDEIV